MKKFPIILALTILAFAPFLTHAGWWRTYGGDDSDIGYGVQQTTDGGYIVIGRTRSFGAGDCDLWILKVDANGDTLWTKTYGGKYWDEGHALEETTDENYIIVGSTISVTDSTGRIWLLKIDKDGESLWSNTYTCGDWSRGLSVAKDSDGGYILTGWTWTETTEEYDLLLLKTDDKGDSVWARIYGNELYDWGQSAQQTADGGYIVTGVRNSEYQQEYVLNGNLWLLKTNDTGDIEWSNIYDDFQESHGYSVLQTSDSGYILTGAIRDPDLETNFLDLLILKTDGQGNTQWTKIYMGEPIFHFDDVGFCIRKSSDGGYIISGVMGAVENSWYEGDVWLLKTDENGDTMWARRYGYDKDRDDRGFWVEQTSDGGYIVCGMSDYSDNGWGDLLLIKTEADGDTLALTENPAAVSLDWQVTSIGSQIVLRYSDRAQGFHAAIFNASGQKVDELHSDLQASTITWGKGFSPGVYFIRETGRTSTAQKAILLK